MLYLIAAIFSSVAVSILFKIWLKRGIKIEQAILINYSTATLLSLLVFKPNYQKFPLDLANLSLFVILGILLPTIFLVFAQSVKSSGIVKSDSAQRLSVIISVLSAFVIFGDEVNFLKIMGIFLAFLALIFLSIQAEKEKHNFSVFWLVLTFLGYGVIDILLKQLSKLGISTMLYLPLIFSSAFLFLFIYLMLKKNYPRLKDAAAGIVLGLFNFLNIFCYIRAHQVLYKQTAAVFTMMNIGVISLATLCGLWFFKEKLNRFNYLGLAFSIIAFGFLFKSL